MILRAALIVLLLAAASHAAMPFPTTVPARVGVERYVRASHRIIGATDARTVVRGHVKVLEVDAGGNETAGELTIEKLARIVDGQEQDLLKAGDRITLKRKSPTRFDYFRADGSPLEESAAKWIWFVTGLRGGADDLDFWKHSAAPENWAVDEMKLRKIIASSDFDLASVRSTTTVSWRNGYEFNARLSIPQMRAKPSAHDPTSRPTDIVDGNFAVECRWRVGDGLQRFRRTRWELKYAGEPDNVKVYEIVGIESATPDEWWAKSQDAVRDEAIVLARASDPLLGFYCNLDQQAALKSAIGSPSLTFQFEKDAITGLIKIRAVRSSN